MAYTEIFASLGMYQSGPGRKVRTNCTTAPDVTYAQTNFNCTTKCTTKTYCSHTISSIMIKIYIVGVKDVFLIFLI